MRLTEEQKQQLKTFSAAIKKHAAEHHYNALWDLIEKLQRIGREFSIQELVNDRQSSKQGNSIEGMIRKIESLMLAKLQGMLETFGQRTVIDAEGYETIEMTAESLIEDWTKFFSSPDNAGLRAWMDVQIAKLEQHQEGSQAPLLVDALNRAIHVAADEMPSYPDAILALTTLERLFRTRWGSASSNIDTVLMGLIENKLFAWADWVVKDSHENVTTDMDWLARTKDFCEHAAVQDAVKLLLDRQKVAPDAVKLLLYKQNNVIDEHEQIDDALVNTLMGRCVISDDNPGSIENLAACLVMGSVVQGLDDENLLDDGNPLKEKLEKVLGESIRTLIVILGLNTLDDALPNTLFELLSAMTAIQAGLIASMRDAAAHIGTMPSFEDHAALSVDDLIEGGVNLTYIDEAATQMMGIVCSAVEKMPDKNKALAIFNALENLLVSNEASLSEKSVLGQALIEVENRIRKLSNSSTSNDALALRAAKEENTRTPLNMLSDVAFDPTDLDMADLDVTDAEEAIKSQKIEEFITLIAQAATLKKEDDTPDHRARLRALNVMRDRAQTWADAWDTAQSLIDAAESLIDGPIETQNSETWKSILQESSIMTHEQIAVKGLIEEACDFKVADGQTDYAGCLNALAALKGDPDVKNTLNANVHITAIENTELSGLNAWKGMASTMASAADQLTVLKAIRDNPCVQKTKGWVLGKILIFAQESIAVGRWIEEIQRNKNADHCDCLNALAALKKNDLVKNTYYLKKHKAAIETAEKVALEDWIRLVKGTMPAPEKLRALQAIRDSFDAQNTKDWSSIEKVTIAAEENRAVATWIDEIKLAESTDNAAYLSALAGLKTDPLITKTHDFSKNKVTIEEAEKVAFRDWIGVANTRKKADGSKDYDACLASLESILNFSGVRRDHDWVVNSILTCQEDAMLARIREMGVVATAGTTDAAANLAALGVLQDAYKAIASRPNVVQRLADGLGQADFKVLATANPLTSDAVGSASPEELNQRFEAFRVAVGGTEPRDVVRNRLLNSALNDIATELVAHANALAPEQRFRSFATLKNREGIPTAIRNAIAGETGHERLALNAWIAAASDATVITDPVARLAALKAIRDNEAAKNTTDWVTAENTIVAHEDTAVAALIAAAAGLTDASSGAADYAGRLRALAALKVHALVRGTLHFTIGAAHKGTIERAENTALNDWIAAVHRTGGANELQALQAIRDSAEAQGTTGWTDATLSPTVQETITAHEDTAAQRLIRDAARSVTPDPVASLEALQTDLQNNHRAVYDRHAHADTLSDALGLADYNALVAGLPAGTSEAELNARYAGLCNAKAAIALPMPNRTQRSKDELNRHIDTGLLALEALLEVGAQDLLRAHSAHAGDHIALLSDDVSKAQRLKEAKDAILSSIGSVPVPPKNEVQRRAIAKIDLQYRDVLQNIENNQASAAILNQYKSEQEKSLVDVIQKAKNSNEIDEMIKKAHVPPQNVAKVVTFSRRK